MVQKIVLIVQSPWDVKRAPFIVAWYILMVYASSVMVKRIAKKRIEGPSDIMKAHSNCIVSLIAPSFCCVIRHHPQPDRTA